MTSSVGRLARDATDPEPKRMGRAAIARAKPFNGSFNWLTPRHLVQSYELHVDRPRPTGQVMLGCRQQHEKGS